MADTGAPLFLPLAPHGADDWDGPIRDGFTAINTKSGTVDTVLAAKADLVGGKIPSDQIPPLSAISVTPVANQAARLALSGATVGTAVLQIDNGSIYVLTALPPATNGNWSAVNPGTAVTSINGETGVVTNYVKLNVNSQVVTATGFKFNNPVEVANATTDLHAVNRGQMNTAIAGVSGGGTAPNSALYGNGALTDFAITHGQTNPYPTVVAVDVDTKIKREVQVEYTSSSVVTVKVDPAPATNKLRISVKG